MFIMPYAFGAFALLLMGIVLVGGYCEEARVAKLAAGKKSCCR